MSYESTKLLSEYLFFHYGREGADGLPVPSGAWNFPARVVNELMDADAAAQCALDVGCAVGRSSFELARTIPRVVGVDFSASFIAAADRLKREGKATCTVVLEGDSTKECEVRIPDGVDASRVSFEIGDAGDLRSGLGAFDVVLAANLLCRLPEPRKFLERLPDLVVPGGWLLLATPFSWLREFTPEANWLGARAGGPSSWEVMCGVLSTHFELQLVKDLPFLIREHTRKFQYGISLGSRWRRS